MLRKFWIFWAYDEILSGHIVLPRNWTCLIPEWHFSIVSINPVWRMHLQTAQMFRIGSVALLAALTISVNFSNGVTVLVVFHSDGLTEAAIVFVVIAVIVTVSPVRIDWGLALALLAALLTWMVKWGKWMRPCVVSMTTLLCLMMCKPIIGRDRFFNNTKCSAKVLSPIPYLSVCDCG